MDERKTFTGPIENPAASQLRAVAYARVSTLLNQDPEQQLILIRQFASARGFALTNEYVDKGISGVRERRPALDALIADAKRGRFKILVVTALDRVGRSTKHLLNLLDELNHFGVRLVSLRENLDFTTPTGQLILTVLAAVSSLEREIIRDRIRNSLAAKKLAAQQSGSGWRSGRPSVMTEEIREQIFSLRAQGLSIRSIERTLDKRVSRATIGATLNSSQSHCPENPPKSKSQHELKSTTYKPSKEGNDAS
ncbi:recombinase family protein [Bdellovibrio bacteriovorus]|uniref:recombinase family protein n=1 Tax=Bdellovibrio bacteriovorus TaxID=959 RepID=UPI0035A62CE4